MTANNVHQDSKPVQGTLPSPTVLPLKSEGAVVIKGLTKRFGSKVAVNDLSFSVPRGSVFGFIGPNGAGKTTTFCMLSGFIRPTSGEAWVLGESVSRVHRLGGRLAALPQDSPFQPHRTILDSMVYLAELGGMFPNEAKNEAQRVLELVDLAGSGKVKGKALSHGMAKRFGIAQAIMGKPELVMLDEPTEGLDPRMANTVRGLVKSLGESGDTTIIISSHNLAEVQDVCDWAVVLGHGKLIAKGSMTELTGADEQVIFTLGEPLAGVEAVLHKVPLVSSITLSNSGLCVRVALKREAGMSVETAITQVLKVLIEAGAAIGSVSRGKTLEEKFLELT